MRTRFVFSATLPSMPTPLQAFIALFLIGGFLRTFGFLNKTHAERLAAFVFSVSLPATILVSLDRATFAPAAWKLPLAAGLVTIPMLFFSWQLARLLHLPHPTQGGFLIATGCINSVYFAYPVVLATFGDEGLARAILFDLGQTTLTLTVLYAVALRHGEASGSATTSISRFLLSPPLWALCFIIMLKFFNLELPSWLVQLLTPIHLTTTPLASLVLGLSINLGTVRRTLRLTSLGVAVRMIGGFLLGFAAAFLLGLSGQERAVVILVAGMPSAVTAVIFATETRLDEDLVASIVTLSICVGVLLLPWLPSLAKFLTG